MTESSISGLEFPVLSQGVRYLAPPRTLGPGSPDAIWRDTLNMLVREGKLLGRPGFTNAGIQPPALSSISGVNTTEVPVQLLESGPYGTSATPQVIVLTNRRILIHNGSWRDATPTYTVGTITATNGSNSITGAGGTQWATLWVSGYIQIDGSWYLFNSTGDTTATITPAFSGVTAAGKAYTIKRVLSSTQMTGPYLLLSESVYGVVYNKQLYVGVGTSTDFGYVIRVINLDAVPSPSYLFGTTTHQTGQDADLDFDGVSGIDVLQDGRVVVSTRQRAAVFYSSHLDDTVWNSAPGGSVDLADVPTGLTAMGRIGSTLTLHHDGGIILADPTGLSDPPLRFQRSGADRGAAVARTLCPYAGGEAFLASDGGVWMFDGNRNVPMESEEISARLKEVFSFADPYSGGVTGALQFGSCFAGAIPAYGVYILFHLNLTTGTQFWIFKDGSWWPGSTTMLLSAMSKGLLGRSPQVWAYVGSSSTSSDGNQLRYFREDQADVLGTPTYMLETDDLDHGAPLHLKTPHRLLLWAVETLANIVASVRTAQAGSYTHTVTKSPGSQVPVAFDFLPNQTSDIPAATAHRYKLAGSDLRKGVFAMHISAALGGDVLTSGQ